MRKPRLSPNVVTVGDTTPRGDVLIAVGPGLVSFKHFNGGPGFLLTYERAGRMLDGR